MFSIDIYRETLYGSVLRIDVNKRDPQKEYSIPPDNPFVNDTNARPEIYAYGLRNPWRCSIDPGEPDTGHGAGRIFCGDVGQDDFEEIDLIEIGKNYGWKGLEGNNCFDDSICDSCELLTVTTLVANPDNTEPYIKMAYFVYNLHIWDRVILRCLRFKDVSIEISYTVLLRMKD